MKQIAVALLSCIALSAAPLLAADGIVGTWQLDLERSEARRNGPPLVEARMVITLDGEDVVVQRDFPRLSFSVTYITDGKPHTIETPVGSQKLRARLKKGKLSVSYTISRGAFEIDINEIWSVKKGELTITYGTRMGERPSVRKEIYTSVGE